MYAYAPPQVALYLYLYMYLCLLMFVYVCMSWLEVIGSFGSGLSRLMDVSEQRSLCIVSRCVSYELRVWAWYIYDSVGVNS